ncbi:right-handed parallel beta-helix repeat-containing protein [Filimonas effusa]|uniref:T9SS type B sorting domain-containing protein n=1 Tax=Filimonas effusa TaxID=2508721 RepID=A0A4Q1D8Z6_9BACT|nr:right-handed parallel beta-helix repeat-containing protein [Filimonas effusa]RXK85837.1 T9SS type B sorting domain-containing protein [Filimonas effusa]
MRKLYLFFYMFLFLFFLVLLLPASSSFAQTSISIGTGTTGNSGTTYPCPLQDYFEGSRMQYLYRATELTAAGMTAGSISNVKFNVTALNGATKIENYSIRIGSTLASSLTDTNWVAVTGPVYGPIDYTPVVGLNTFIFSAPFMWDGSSNIIIEVCNGSPNAPSVTTFSNNPTVPWTTGLSFNGSHTFRVDGTVGPFCDTTATINNGTQTTRPNIIFTWQAFGGCTIPPVGGTAVRLPLGNVCENTQVALTLSGNSLGGAQTYQWQKSATSGAGFTDVGSPGTVPGTTVTATIGTSYYRCAVSCGGSTAYSAEVTVVGIPALPTGNYTINSGSPTGGNNFNSFNAAIAAMSCGITGPVTFDVTTVGAVYNEQVIIPEILGVSATNTITFKGNGNTLEFVATASGQRATLKLDGADYITFDSLNIVAAATTSSQYGYGVQLINNADNNTFNRCKITSHPSFTSTSFAGIVVNSIATGATTSGATLCDNNTFSNNIISGGYYGITLVGGSSDAIAGNKITGNTIQDFEYYGIYSTYSNGTLIQGNHIARPNRIATNAFNAVYLGSGVVGVNVLANRIYDPMGGNNSSTDIMYGIRFDGAGGTSAAPNTVANNILYDFNGAGAIYGLYTTASPYTRFYHNTVSLDNANNNSSGLTRGFHEGTSATGVELKNNIITISRGGGGTNYAIYIPTGSTLVSDYNNLYIVAGGSNAIGYRGSALTGLSDWQNETGLDKLSVSINPQYTAPGSGNFLPGAAPAWDNLGDPVGIANDINGALRSTSVPDLGAYENAISVCTTPPVAGDVLGSSTICKNQAFSISLRNGTAGSGQTYQWQSSADNITFTNIPGATSVKYATTPPLDDSLFYRCVVTCNGMSSVSDTLKVNFFLCYCSSVPTYTADTEIFNVTLNGASNSSTCDVVAPGQGSILARYSNFYPNGPLTTLVQGSTVPFSVLHEDCTPNIYYNAACAIWIDFNRDGDFEDAGEKVFVENATVLGPRLINGNISIPLGAVPGVTGMRIILAEGYSGADLKPCMSYAYGETEDYFVTIKAAEPCVGIPTAGAATSSKNFVCPGETFDLTITGTPIATGLTYQWQQSSDNATWTNISGANSTQLQLTQQVTTYYRYIITCVNGGASTNAPSVLISSPGIVSGNYSINNAVPTGGTNFRSFNDAYDFIKCGINGSVTFNVEPGSGPYNEQLIMKPIPGASAVNTVTFNGNGATISYRSINNTERAVIKLDGADHIIFDSLVISASGSSSAEYGFGVQLINNADSNIVRKCIVNINTSSTSSNYAGIVISASASSATSSGTASACDGNLFEGNTITGGYYGFTMVGGSGTGMVSNRFINNTIKEFYYYGIYLAYPTASLIQGNSISRPGRSTISSFYGIYLTSGGTKDTITGNRLFNTMGSSKTSTSSQYGIYVDGCDATTADPVIVSNNLLYNFNGLGEIRGLYNYSSDNIHYLHNTISFDNIANISNTATAGFYQNISATGLRFKNNIVTVLRGGGGDNYAVNLLIAGSAIDIDYNNYLLADSATSFVGILGTTKYKNLIDWKNGTVHDDHAVSFNPEYLDPNGGDYRPMSNLLDNMGTPVNVSVDINKDARSTTTPDIGAYEYLAVACPNPPVPGTVVSSLNPACLNVPFTLGIEGGVTGYGQTYQWQSSLNNTDWNNIPGATGRSLTTTQGQSTYYRVIYTCGAGVPSASFLLTTPSLVSGNFTIDKSLPSGNRNFQSFNEAYNALRCGINGPVVFDVNGTGVVYTEQLTMGHIEGTSTVNTITFNGNGATIRNASINSEERAVIKLNGAKHIIFDSLILDARSGDYGYGVQLMNNTDSNVVRRCIINISQTATTDAHAGIVVSGSASDAVATGLVLTDDNIFEYNRINGGYYGITLVASFTNGANGRNIIRGNTIRDFYSTGIYVAGSYGTIIDSNSISRPNRADVGEFRGILFTTQKNAGCFVTRNRISNPYGSAETSTTDFYGINFNNSDGSTGNPAYNENTVSNNLIYGINGQGASYGIMNTSSDYTYYFHNTIVLDNLANTSSKDSRGFYQTTAAAGLYFMNNLVSVTTGGTGSKYCVYLNNLIPLGMDYNNYYMNAVGGSSYVGYYSSSRSRLADWVQATGVDVASVSTIPAFVNPSGGDYTPGNAGLNNKGIFAGITNDIVNKLRDTNTPDIGAYEFTPPPCTVPPVNGHVLISPLSLCQNKPLYLSMDISAYGEGQTFQWQTATQEAGPYKNLGNPMKVADTTISSDTTLYFRVVASCGTSSVFSDTIHVVVNPALRGGTYSIDKNTPTNYIPGQAGGNFNSFAAAKNAMGCGITGGPVVFNVAPNSGPYNEKLLLDSIPGVSAINTITFNGNGNTITANSTTSSDRAVITLRGADHITFDSLVINTGTGTYGYGVQLLNNADSNTFRRNTIVSSLTATNTNYAGIVVNATDAGPTTTGNTLCDGNLFERNTISGGAFGITLVGNTTAAGFIGNNRVIDNTISDFYTSGLYLAGTVNTIVDGNNFTRLNRANSAASAHGIYLTSAPSNRLKINGNRFSHFTKDMPADNIACYAVYHNAVDAGTGNEDTVSNNLIYGFEGAGALYGFYNDNANNVRYYHNTIAFDNTVSTTAAVTAGFYQTGTASGIAFKNNIVTITRGGAGNKFGIYRSATASEIESSNNDLYILGANSYAGYANGASRKTIAELAFVTGQDLQTVSQNPLYTDSAVGDFKPQLALIDNLGTREGITVDFNKTSRSTTTPDIGAYEFTPLPCASPLIAGTAAVTPASGLCLEMPIQLNITGHSPLGSITFQWEASADGAAGWKAISDVRYFPTFDTVTAVNSYYRARVECGGTVVYTNVVNVSLNNILPAGTYTIDNSTPQTYVPGVAGGNFTSFNAAVTGMLCGIGGKVVFDVRPGTNGVYNEQVNIPYIPGTSADATVTFRSENANPASVNLSYAATTADNYTLKLDSVKNFIFRDLTISATNAAAGRAIVFTRGSSSDSLLNNVIALPVVSASSQAAVGVLVETDKGSGLVIKGNKIHNGLNGVSFSGSSNTSLSGLRHVIDGNEIEGTYSHAVRAAFVNRITITNNTIALTGTHVSNTAGIYTNYADSLSRITGNVININGATGNAVHGIYIFNTRAIAESDSAIVAGNRVVAGANNTDSVYGVTITASKGVQVVNNVVALNSAGEIAYGLYSLANNGAINFYNNTINILSASSKGYAGYFSQTATASLNVRNNIFSNKGGGKALFVNNPGLFTADYNMLYSTGAVLVQVATGTTLEFGTLAEWKNVWNWDASSIGFEPAFADNATLKPDLNNPDVWAMHGRGTQIAGNSYDFDNQPRVENRVNGVPDLGAYEFYPVAQPSVLLATPATPAPDITQVFSYGTDTVMRIKWGATVPSGVAVRRFSGVAPSGLPPATDSMFFYTQVEVQGTNDHIFDAKLYYVDSWQGSIPNQNKLGLGRTTAANAWVVGATSRIDVRKKEIGQDAMLYMDKFTGLVNPFAQPEEEDSSSNRGKDFWIGYQRTNGFLYTTPGSTYGGDQVMNIYMGAGDVPANVTISIEGNSGTAWTRNYFVPANTALTSDEMPKTGTEDARLFMEGMYAKKGIHITSDVPIVVYAHIYESTNSGATMLMPTSVWGYEYYTLSSRQNYTPDSYAAFHIVAQHDSTWVEINPSKPTFNGWLPNGGTRANGSYLVKLNKGDAYQVLGANIGGDEGQDLSGSYVKSVGNAQGECFPIGVFAGSTRTAIGCGTSPGGSGDLIIQQVFPYQAWGTKYATAPTSMIAGPSAATLMTNVYRVMVKDPTTIVKRNNTALPLSSLINNKYYQFESSAGDYIESDKPILVAQFMSSEGQCGVAGYTDPEMFYLSPVQQAIKRTQFYRNNLDDIDNNFITLVIPTEGLNTLRIDNVSYLTYPAAERYVYSHPNLPGYSVVTKKWAAGSGSSTVESEMPFTGVVYGLGSVESYGYNIGTLVKNLNNLSSVNTTFNTGANPTDYTCKGSPFKVKIMLPIPPTSIKWELSKVPNLSPNNDTTITNPVATDTVEVDGVTYYGYTLPKDLLLDTVGIIHIPVQYTSPLIEKCSNTATGVVVVQILPAPVTDFSIAFPGGGAEACVGTSGTFTGDIVTENGIALNQWNWTFPVDHKVSGRTQSYIFADAGTHAVKLEGITADGCVSDTAKNVVIHPRPVVVITRDSLPTCTGTAVTFTIDNPEAGATYNWYDAPTGGTLKGSGVSFTPDVNTVLPATFYAEGVSGASCASVVRKKVTVYHVDMLAKPIVAATATPFVITFTWTAVTGATAYEVSLDGGVTFITPSSGSTGLTHVIEGLAPFTEKSLIVRATGVATCQSVNSDELKAKTVSDEVFAANAFTPNGDNKNDEFKVYGYTIKEMKFVVFNQWGEKVAETVNPSMDANGAHIVWDGRYKGQFVSSGVYMYVAQITLQNGNKITKKGSINLIR